MKRCPRCGNYMNSYLEYIFGSARTVWTCSCGYVDEIQTTVTGNTTKNIDLSRATNHTGPILYRKIAIPYGGDEK